MIRLHLVPTQLQERDPTYRVSARRVPKGHVRSYEGNRCERKTGHLYASVTWYPCTKWVVLDLDLLPPKYPLMGSPPVRPEGYDSREEAIQALLNWASAQPPLPRPPTSGKLLESRPIRAYLFDPGSPQAEAMRQAYNATDQELGAAAVKAAKKL